MSLQTKRRVAVFLAISLVAPLLVATAAAASAPASCPGCPPPVSAPVDTPCHGSLLLVCCDDVSTAPDADRPRIDTPPAGFARPSPFVSNHPGTPALPSQPAWLRSPLRHSVVLRV